MKRIFIIGAGFTGIELAKMLILEGKHVVLIDNDAERVRHASDQLDCTVIAANGNDLEVLERAGIASADALVTLTADDETNMITCSLVDAVYPNILKIARVRTFSYYHTVDLTRRRLARVSDASRPLYGIDVMLNPEVEASTAIGNAVEHGAVGNVIDLGNGYLITMISVGEGSPLVGIPFRQLKSIEGWHYLVAFVEAGGRPALPNGDTVLRAGDSLGVVSKATEVGALAAFTKRAREAFRRVVLFGADRVGTLLLAHFEEKFRASFWSSLFGASTPSLWRELVVVDQDAARCREVAAQFPGARVLCGDITDEALLTEENLCDCDLMIAASGNHELNLVAAAYMKTRGVARCIALTANAAYREVARKLGIDVTVALRGAVVDGIMGHLRGRHVAAIHSVCNRAFEIVEGDIPSGSPVAGRRLGDLGELSAGSLVLLAGVGPAGSLEVPCGDTVLQVGAHVVLIAPPGDARILGRFFGKV